ncbi:MAG: hypothetical protein MUC68_00195 [Burkholderiaceae bacterium]|jgi:hypothetical protein|nr:hypothetical protein [Burkholderiaceae bacterium]
MNQLQKRRAIIKGSLAAPVVLTVSSASATAATSFGRCLRNGAKSQPAFFVTKNRLDNWLRKQVDIVELSFNGKSRGWFYLDPLSRVYVGVQPPHQALTFGSTMLPGWQQSGTAKRWALVYIDSSNAAQYRHVTLQKPTGYMAATVSCYSSFRI